jgi:hypothetical protein
VTLARGPAVQSPKRRKTGYARQANEECTRAYRPTPYPAAGCCNARTVNRPASTRRRADRREHQARAVGDGGQSKAHGVFSVGEAAALAQALGGARSTS